MRRRRPPPPAPRSDFTETAGRLFADGASWNRPLGGRERVDTTATRVLGAMTAVELATGPRVVHVAGAGREVYLVECAEDGTVLKAHCGRVPLGMAPRGDLVVVDHRARTVVAAREWRVLGDGFVVEGLDVADLDDDRWGSPAVGLVLERELCAGWIPHAVGLWVPDAFQLYGARVRYTAAGRLDPAEQTVAKALGVYGGIVVGVHDVADRLLVRVEASSSASPGDPIGPTYRQLGVGTDPWPMRLAPAGFEVLG